VETQLFESRLFSRDFSTIVHVFQFRRGDVTDGLEEPAVIEPVDPFERRVFHVVQVSPRSFLSDEFGLVEADDGLGESIVIAVAPGADGGDGPGFGLALGVADGEVLDTAVGMVDDAGHVLFSAGPQSHLQGIERQVGA